MDEISKAEGHVTHDGSSTEWKNYGVSLKGRRECSHCGLPLISLVDTLCDNCKAGSTKLSRVDEVKRGLQSDGLGSSVPSANLSSEADKADVPQTEARRGKPALQGDAESRVGTADAAVMASPRSNGSIGSRPPPEFADWPDPGEIQGTLSEVPAFDSTVLLPEALRDWVMDEANRMPCPPEYIAATAVVALGSVIGTRCAIRPKANDDWLIVPNLWGGIVGLPSAMKSPAISAALSPLDRLVAGARKAHRDAQEAFAASEVAHAARRKAIEDKLNRAAKDPAVGDVEALALELQDLDARAPVKPIERRFKTDDSTVEKLGELLRDNPNGLLVKRDELVGLIASWEREGREADRAFFLEAWNGTQSFNTDRIGRGSITIDNLCLSIFGGIQPDKLTGHLKQAAHALSNDGMLQRLQLLLYPDLVPWEYRDRKPDQTARERVFRVFESLAEFNPPNWGAMPADTSSRFPYFRFDAEAQEVFIAWISDLHGSRLPAEENPLLVQHLVKYTKLMPSLALIFHLVDCAATGSRGPITKESALRAAAWCQLLECHARRCYGLLADEGLRAALALAEMITLGKLKDGFTARDIRRTQRRHLTSDQAIQDALQWLVSENWLRPQVTGGTGRGSGRPTTKYMINPKVMTRQAEADGG